MKGFRTPPAVVVVGVVGVVPGISKGLHIVVGWQPALSKSAGLSVLKRRQCFLGAVGFNTNARQELAEVHLLAQSTFDRIFSQFSTSWVSVGLMMQTPRQVKRLVCSFIPRSIRIAPTRTRTAVRMCIVWSVGRSWWSCTLLTGGDPTLPHWPFGSANEVNLSTASPNLLRIFLISRFHYWKLWKQLFKTQIFPEHTNFK